MMLKKFPYTAGEIKIFKKLNSPKKVQDFLEGLKINFEKGGDTCYSPRMVLKHRTGHCMEGAMLAAAILEFHGYEPLVMDLRSEEHDFDHVVTVFKQYGCWGAISKTNHAVLRYREPVYRTIRELALSYFHEYFDSKGRKTLREYSKPFNLKYFDKNPIYSNHPASLRSAPLLEKEGRAPQNWRTSSENLFAIPDYLDEVKHFNILLPAQIKNLRRADNIEIKAGELVEWKRK